MPCGPGSFPSHLGFVGVSEVDGVEQFNEWSQRVSDGVGRPAGQVHPGLPASVGRRTAADEHGLVG